MKRINIIKNQPGLIWAFTATVLVSVAACTGKEPKTSTETLASTPIVAPATTPVQYNNPPYTLSLPAELKPYEQVAVFAKVTGFVKQLHVDRGDHVRKGQLLATLEAPEMNQKYLSDKSAEEKVYSDYLFATQAYDRLVEASATTGAVAEIELERAKNAMESAKSAYEASKAGTQHSSQLQQYLRITAPFDGVITARNLSVGALAGTGTSEPLFMVAQGNRLRLTVSLPEKHAASVSDQMMASFTVSSHPGKTFEAIVSRTSGLLDQHDRSLTLEFDVDNKSGELHGGEYAQVQLSLKRKRPSYWVPNKSIVNSQTGTFIMTMNDDEIKRIPVKEGIRLDTLTEIFGAITDDDLVLKKPSEEIKTGKVNR